MSQQGQTTSENPTEHAELENLLDVLADIVIDSFIAKKQIESESNQDFIYTTMVGKIKKT